jgi:hypothetical protein
VRERSGSGEIINLAPSHFVAQKVMPRHQKLCEFSQQWFHHHLVSLLLRANFYISISSLSIKLLAIFCVCYLRRPRCRIFLLSPLKLLEQQREALIHQPTSQQ